jgi:CRP-like cAMP-binding protein
MKPEKTEDIKLGITDVELLQRPSPRESLMSQRPSARTLAQLPAMPLFAEVPRYILEALIRESTLIDVEDGQRLVTADTRAEALYVLVEGNAVGRRGEEVIACGRVRALRISKLLLDGLVRQHPPFDDVLFEILSRRLVATLLRTNPIFTPFDERTRRQIAGLFEVRRALAGTKIVEAVREVLVLRMPAARFSDLLMKRPDIVQHIQVVKRRQSMAARLQ